MPIIERLDPFSQFTSGSIEFDILDREGEPVPVAGILTAELTLRDWDTGAARVGSPYDAIINNRDSQDVLNLNDVTLSDSPTVGHVLWEMQPADNVILTDRRQVERHRATFHFTWNGGEFYKEYEILVNNLRLQG